MPRIKAGRHEARHRSGSRFHSLVPAAHGRRVSGFASVAGYRGPAPEAGLRARPAPQAGLRARPAPEAGARRYEVGAPSA